MAIEITAKPRTALDVDLVGVRYSVKPPKSAVAFKMAVRAKTAADDPTLILEAVDEWIDKAFGPKQAKAVRARLANDDDDLDITQILELMEAVIEEATGDPTTSPPDTSTSP